MLLVGEVLKVFVCCLLTLGGIFQSLGVGRCLAGAEAPQAAGAALEGAERRRGGAGAPRGCDRIRVGMA